MMLRRLTATLLMVTGCVTAGTPQITTTQVQTAFPAATPLPADGGPRDASESAASTNNEPSAVVAGPEAERAVGYVAIVTGVIVIAGVVYWTVKLAKLLGH